MYMVFFISCAVIKMSCLFLCWLLALFVIAFLVSLKVLVEHMPCLCPIMCPFCVSSYSGNNLVTLVMLISGEVR